jgi:hypothetical protein
MLGWVVGDSYPYPRRKFPMLYTIVVVLLILWLLGFIGHIGGGLIHLLLVIAVIVLIFNFISGRR